MSSRSLLAGGLGLTLLLSSGAALGQSTASPQVLTAPADESGRKIGQRKLLLTDVQLLGKHNAFKGFDDKTFNSVLMFALSSVPSLDVYSSASSNPTIDNLTRIPTLASNVRDLQGTAVWTGDLSKPEGTAVRLGPVVLSDNVTSRLDALRTIVELIVKALNEAQPGSASAVMPAAVRAICVAPGADDNIARELRGNVLAALQQERIFRRGNEALLCESRGEQRTDDDAVLIFGTSAAPSPSAILKWRPGNIPLPAFGGTEDGPVQDRDDYPTLLAKATRSYIRDCPRADLTQAVEAFSGSEAARVDAAQAIMVRRECPFVAAALLDTLGADKPEVLVDLARAYREAGQPQVSTRLLRPVLERAPSQLEAELRYELALADYEQDNLDDAVRNFKLALGKKPQGLRDAHIKLAQAAYLVGDRETATTALNVAMLRDGFDVEARVLAINLALDRAALRDETGVNTTHFAEALEHAKVALPNAPRGTSAIESVVRNIASRAAAAEPTLAPNMQIAEQTLTLLIDWVPDDAALYLQRGRARIWLASEDLEKRLVALRDLSKAADLLRAQGGAVTPELQVIDLELAEGNFVNGKYREAAAIAQRFIARKASRDPTTASYDPVAFLLDYAGEALAGRGKVSRGTTERFLARTKSFSEWPSLVAPITSSESKESVKVAEWSFGTFDSYLCASKHPSRADVLNASRTLQKQLKGSRDPLKCPTVPPKRT